MTQPQCKTFCYGLNGELPTILNENENTRLHWQMKYYDQQRSWIGLYDTTEDDTHNGWVWPSGTPLSYSRWKKNEPNNPAERCAAFYKTGYWIDMHCTRNLTCSCQLLIETPTSGNESFQMTAKLKNCIRQAWQYVKYRTPATHPPLESPCIPLPHPGHIIDLSYNPYINTDIYCLPSRLIIIYRVFLNDWECSNWHSVKSCEYFALKFYNKVDGYLSLIVLEFQQNLTFLNELVAQKPPPTLTAQISVTWLGREFKISQHVHEMIYKLFAKRLGPWFIKNTNLCLRGWRSSFIHITYPGPQEEG